jgi:exosome complex component CSL4
MPGEDIAASEEFSVGEGTHEKDGRIFSSVAGFVALDAREMVARVVPINPPGSIAVGDFVLGEVTEVRGTMVNVGQLTADGDGRKAVGGDSGTLHISKVADGRTEDLRELFRIGDIVRAKVVQVKPSLQLATAGPDLGVVKAYCTRCRAALEPDAGNLKCGACERVERRKMARGYSIPRLFRDG